MNRAAAGLAGAGGAPRACLVMSTVPQSCRQYQVSGCPEPSSQDRELWRSECLKRAAAKKGTNLYLILLLGQLGDTGGW